MIIIPDWLIKKTKCIERMVRVFLSFVRSITFLFNSKNALASLTFIHTRVCPYAHTYFYDWFVLLFLFLLTRLSMYRSLLLLHLYIHVHINYYWHVKRRAFKLLLEVIIIWREWFENNNKKRKKNIRADECLFTSTCNCYLNEDGRPLDLLHSRCCFFSLF